MRILLLTGPDADLSLPFLRGEDVEQRWTPITPQIAEKYDLGLSWGYRHIVKPDVLDVLQIANCHIALLPMCRGADPCLWGWIEGVHGVTAHWMSKQVDAGPIISQKKVFMSAPQHTLRTSYQVLQREMGKELTWAWEDVVAKKDGTPQVGKSSLHRTKDLSDLKTWLATQEGWDTPVEKMLAHYRGSTVPT